MALGIWRSPRGRPLEFEFREGTNDWNTIQSCTVADEYGLADFTVAGWALDIGAYLGSVTVALLADNPDAHVLAVEPVPDNVRLIRRNLELNGFSDRAIVVEAAAGPPGVSESEIRWNYRGEEGLEHHAFVGNTSLAYERGGDLPHDAAMVPTFDYSALWRIAGHRLELVKIDAEGAEWGFLADPAIGGVPLILGEWHPVLGMTRADLLDRLGATHDVTFSGPESGPGGFRAVRRFTLP